MSRVLRPIRVDGDIALVPLSRGYVATVDATLLHLVEGRNWSALVSPRRKTVYAVRVDTTQYKQTMVLMHRLLLRASPSAVVDHIDGDGLNNRLVNLRECTRAENALNVGLRADNKTGCKGVFLDSRSGKFRSEIRRNGVSIYLGLFDTAEDAHEAYRTANARLHGQFGRVA